MDLGATGNPRAVEPLIRALDDNNVKVVLNAIWSLAEIGDLRAMEPLQQAYRHRDKSVRKRPEMLSSGYTNVAKATHFLK